MTSLAGANLIPSAGNWEKALAVLVKGRDFEKSKAHSVFNIQRVYLDFLEALGLREDTVPGEASRAELVFYADGMLTREALRERMDRVDADLSRLGADDTPKPMTEKAKRSALRTVDVMRQAWSRAKPAAKREIVEHLAAKAMLTTSSAPVFEWRDVRELTDA